MIFVEIKKRKRFIKRFLAVTGILVVMFFLLQMWFFRNAQTILKQYITEQSDGRIELELADLDLNIFSKQLQIREGDLRSTDSTTAPITYRVTFSKLSIKVNSLWQLLFEKKLLLDSIKIYNPQIRVMQWRKDTSRVQEELELSLPQEMGKVYNVLLKALDEFGVRRIVIDRAKFSLINKMNPGSEPVIVSNIFFDLARAPAKKGETYVFAEREQKLVLRTSDQDINLAGGRHRLSFKSFTLRLFKQSIELDSCTISALPTDSLKSNYKIFFQKLLLTGVDFAALSAENVIRADTVYCESPFFDINLYSSDAPRKVKEVPDPDKIIRELTGNLDFAFVDVKNAGIYIDIFGDKKRTFSNSRKDNFKIRGLHINPDSLQPVSIRQFDMTMNDYQLYNEDSTSVFSFDNLHLLDKKIILNNFGFLSKSSIDKRRNLMDIRVPYFELSELNWYRLIFEQTMAAKEAILRNPVINFTRRTPGTPGKKLDIFGALVNLDSLVALENVSVSNGRVNMQLGPTTAFNVQDINFKIRSNKLLSATTKEELPGAIEHFSFASGELRLKDITAQLANTYYTRDNLLHTEKIAISGLGKTLQATINDVYIDNLQFDNNADTIEVDGIRWESAVVGLKALPAASGGGDGSSNIYLRNIAGNNTQLNFSGGSTVFATYIKNLSALSLIKQGDNIQANGFKLIGNNLAVSSKNVNVSAHSYEIGNDSTFLADVLVEQLNGRDSLSIQSPEVNLSINLNDLFADDLHFADVHAQAPVIRISKWNTTDKTPDFPAVMQSPIRIDNLRADEPVIMIYTHFNDSVSVISIPRSDNSIVTATGIILSAEGIQIDSLNASTTAATVVKPTGEIVGIENGKIDVNTSNIRLGKKNGKLNWSGFVNQLSLQNPQGLSVGNAESKLNFKQASVGNLNLSSESLPDFARQMRENVSAWLRIPEGRFVDSNSTFRWHNAQYDNFSRTMSIDSLTYHPTQSLDSVLAKAAYELDYITLKTGVVTINGLVPQQYESDSSFVAHTITINKPVLTIFRDKKPPSSPTRKDKLFPANLIKSLTFPVDVQKIRVNEGTITYSEKTEKSRKEGTLLLSRINATVEHIKNRELSDQDSLSLTFNASLMDSARISLRLKQSYTDSLNRLLWQAKVGSADLSILNPVLIPLANVKITGGVLDSISIHSVIREDVSLGEMDMHYRNLRIKLINDGDPEQSTFLQNVASILANTFLVKSNNTKRKGIMYYENPRGQTFIYYIVKTTLSGVLSSVGIKRNRKYKELFKKEAEEVNNPEITVK